LIRKRKYYLIAFALGIIVVVFVIAGYNGSLASILDDLGFYDVEVGIWGEQEAPYSADNTTP